MIYKLAIIFWLVVITTAVTFIIEDISSLRVTVNHVEDTTYGHFELFHLLIDLIKDLH